MNIDVTAHILVGYCIDKGFNGDQEELYNQAKRFLGYNRTSASEKFSSRTKLNNLVVGKGISDSDRTQFLKILNLLTFHYIQCVEYPNPLNSERIGFIKLRFSDQGIHPVKENEDYHDGVRKVRMEVRSSDQLKMSNKSDGKLSKRLEDIECSEDQNPTAATPDRTAGQHDAVSESRSTLRLKRIKENAGISTTISFPIIFGWTNTEATRHIRFVAPSGTKVEDISFLQGNVRLKSGTDSGDILINHNSERGFLLARDQNHRGCEIQVGVNPTLGQFLVPAFFASFLQLVFALVALKFGPQHLVSNAAAFTGTALVAPFITVVFIAKDSEHELVGRILRFPRILLAASSTLLVIGGALLSILPKPRTTVHYICSIDRTERLRNCIKMDTSENFNSTAFHEVTFATLSLVIILSTGCMLLFISIMWRIQANKSLIEKRKKIMFENNYCLQNPPKTHDRTSTPPVSMGWGQGLIGVLAFWLSLEILVFLVCWCYTSYASWVAV